MLRRKSDLTAALLALTLFLVLASGCASHRGTPNTSAPPPPPPPPQATATITAPEPPPSEADCPPCIEPDSPNTIAAYAAAIENAKYPASSRISRDLTPLLPSTEGLKWNDGRILFVCNGPERSPRLCRRRWVVL